ncbi:MAG: DUF2784 domain-containing protein [Gemmatimonadales bacterium]|jgi:hypothetical protein
MLYRLLADLVVLIHLAFVIFAVAGALLVLRWRWLVWAHVPAVVWAALIEFAGWVCPLTPLENRLRILSGGAGYRGGFVDHYLLQILYPSGLTRGVQVFLGGLVLLVNVGLYAWLVVHTLRAPVEGDGAAR